MELDVKLLLLLKLRLDVPCRVHELCLYHLLSHVRADLVSLSLLLAMLSLYLCKQVRVLSEAAYDL